MIALKSYLKNNILSKIKLASISDRFQLPEKWKGGRVERWSQFWQALINDYKIVASDVVQEAKTKPKKAVVITSALALTLTAMQCNPDKLAFYDQYIKCSSQLIMVADSIQNPTATNHIQYLANCDKKNLLRRANLIFCSLIWVADYNEDCQLYSAQCKYLKPRYLTFYERIIDVGLFGTWINLLIKMRDFDVNPNEWVVEK